MGQSTSNKIGLLVLIVLISLVSCQQLESDVSRKQQKTSELHDNKKNAQQTSPSSSTTKQNPLPNSRSSQLPYTQNIQQFKSKKYSQRLQTVVGCWLLSKQYLDQYKSNYLFFTNQKLKQLVTLKLVKQCMKRISRKDAVLKITELVGKNMTAAKKYQEVVLDQVIINEIFIQVNKKTVVNAEQYQEEDIRITNNNTIEQLSTLENPANVQQKYAKQPAIDSQNNLSNNNNQMSQFDIYLLGLINKYDSEFSQLKQSKQGLKGKVQQQLKKRQKYYFGFIPASTFTHSVFLVTISLSMVFCCTCYKYYKMRTNQRNSLKMKQGDEQGHVHSASCSHSRPTLKQMKKMASKMSQMTMKRKAK